MENSDIFAVPIDQKVLIYAPLQNVSALINRPAYFGWAEYLRNDRPACSETARDLFSSIAESIPVIPAVRSGPLTNPLFLGILPTRACNMGCRYCDFLESSRLVMPVEIARNAIESYLDLLEQNGLRTGEIHFFGGEPFEAPELVQFSVEFARLKAKERKISLRFEAVTNGFYSKPLAEWASQNIDTIVLSFDGFAGCQDHHRPSKEGNLSFETVSSNARLFSGSDCELVIRSCISDENVRDLRKWAEWIGENMLPSVVCLEPMIETEVAKVNQLKTADLLLFVRNFCEAADVLSAYGILTVLSTADITVCRNSVCPLGQDALVVTPEGNINACYQIEKQWLAVGLDLSLGSVHSTGFDIPQSRIDAMRIFSVENKRLCRDCFCRFHCAGGCHISHNTDKPAGQYDEFCLETRMITAALLLDELGEPELKEKWLANDESFAMMAAQSSDRWIDQVIQEIA